jgi:hypothetical protein
LGLGGFAGPPTPCWGI